MYKKIEEYLTQLKRELRGSDPALIQDALSDAEEHFSTALEESVEKTPGIPEEEALQPLIERYGTPDEVAAAYTETESRMLPTLAVSETKVTRTHLAKFFAVAAEARTWGAFLYILLSCLTAIVYGMWTLIAGAFSLFSLILIIGIPLTGFYLLSLRGIALVEGRIIEALLGIRMPRKPIFLSKGLNWRKKYRALITESYTWKVFSYMMLHFALGLIYFFVVLTMFAASIKVALYPLWYWGFGRALITLSQPLYPPAWSYPLVSAAGILMFFLTLHLARFIGKTHGRFAKFMLVRKQQEIDHV
jgi:uncharacterized membrane protein